MAKTTETFAHLVARLPEWGRLFDAAAYEAFIEAVREITSRGEPLDLHEDYARIADSWDLPLLPLAQNLGQPERIREEVERRAAEEKLGRELDAVRGDFARARGRCS